MSPKEEKMFPGSVYVAQSRLAYPLPLHLLPHHHPSQIPQDQGGVGVAKPALDNEEDLHPHPLGQVKVLISFSSI